jgi:FkbM family methyltransferase
MLRDFGLVVLGAHSGIHLKKLISRYDNKNILLVEPVPYNYLELESIYGKSENIFISRNGVIDQNKIDSFYFVKKDSIPVLGKHWASQIGSFNKNHILNHKNKRFKIEDSDIDKIDIKFITFNDLIKEYSIGSIEMLQIDTEGAEYKIMKSINYDQLSINQILFESKHFDGTFKESERLDEIKKLLTSKNYKLRKQDKENILAVK